MKKTVYDDATLVALARGNDRDAFNLLLERYHLMGTCLALRLIGEREIACELVQEAMLQAFLSLDRLRDGARFKSWFYGIVLNMCRHWKRGWRFEISLERAAQASIIEQDGIAPLFSADPQELIEEWEIKQLLQEALATLSQRNRSVAMLFYYHDLSIQEIAARLDIPVATVKNRLFRARQQLRATLAPHFITLQPVAGKDRRNRMIKTSVVQIIEDRGRALVLLMDEEKQRVMPYHLWRDNAVYFIPMLRLHRVQWEMNGAFETHPGELDFLVGMLQALNGTLEGVQIDALNSAMSYAVVRLRAHNGVLHELKVHIADALPLAIRLHSPILIPEDLFNLVSRDLSSYEGMLEQKLAAIAESAKNYRPFHRKMIIDKSPDNLDFREGKRGWSYLLYYFRPGLVDVEIDPQVTYNGRASLKITLRPRTEVPQKPILAARPHMVTLMHEGFLADKYCGKCVHLRGFVRGIDVERAHFSLQVTMAENPIHQDQSYRGASGGETLQGTSDWTPYELTMDIPQEATAIEISFVLYGKGEVWLSGLEFTVIESEAKSLSGK